MNLYKKYFIILIILTTLICSLQAISASTINETQTISGSENDFKIDFDVEDINYGENATVGVNVPNDADGDVSLNVRGGNQIVYTGVQKVTNASSIFIIPNLNGGTYTVAAQLLNDSRYTGRIFYEYNAFEVNSIDTSITATSDSIYVGENATIIVNLDKRCSDEVQVDINDNIVSADIIDGIATIHYPNLANGTYTAYIDYFGDDNFNSASTSVIIKVSKISDYAINISYPKNIIASDNVIIDFALPDDINDNITVKYDDNSYIIKTTNGLANLSINKIVKGTHLIEVSYDGNDKYVYKNNESSIYAEPVDLNLSFENPVVNKSQDIIITLPSDATGNISVNLGNMITVPVNKGIAIINTTNIPAGVYDNTQIEYSGDDKYNSKKITDNIKIKTDDYILDIKVNDIQLGNVEMINITLPVDITENVVVSVAGKNNNVKITKGRGSLSLSNLNYGHYNVTVEFGGNGKYLAKINQTAFNVFVKTPIDINTTPLVRGDDFVVHFPDDATGNLTVVIGNQTITVPVTNGSAVISTDNIKPNNYTLEIIYSGDNKYSSYNISSNLSISSRVIITVDNLTKYFSDPSRFIIKVSNSEDEMLSNYTVNVILNGVTYTKTTNINGTTSIPLKLNSGVYSVIVNDGNVQEIRTITILATVNATNIVKVFRNATQYYATFRDAKGDYLARGTEVEFNINGVFYKRNVNNNGLAKLNLHLEQGSYILTAINPITKEMCANNITILPTIIGNKDLVKYQRNNSQYVVQLVGSDGKIVGAGETIMFNINGVFYNITTNSSGHAKLNINLNPGDYIITGEYKGCRVSNNIKVLPVLIGSDVYKKYGDSEQYHVTLLDGTGKPFSGEKIQLNINGVVYTRTTNSNGVASLNLNLQPGIYIITAQYNNIRCGNTITITS